MSKELSAEVSVAVVILVSNSHHYITQRIYEQFLQAEDNAYFKLPNGSVFKKSAVMDILSVEEYAKQFPQKVGSDMHQPYAEEEAMGYNGLIKRATRTSALEALKRGLTKAKGKIQGVDGLTARTPNIDELVRIADERLLLIAEGKPTDKMQRTYEPKYKNWEAAKAAGVV